MMRSKWIVILSCIISLFISVNVLAQTEAATTTTVVEKKVVVTPPPKSVKCTTVNAHWEDSVWIDTQTVCTYEQRSEGVAWIQDYWACTAATVDGNCTAWEYRPGHWVKTYP